MESYYRFGARNYNLGGGKPRQLPLDGDCRPPTRPPCTALLPCYGRDLLQVVRSRTFFVWFGIAETGLKLIVGDKRTRLMQTEKNTN